MELDLVDRLDIQDIYAKAAHYIDAGRAEEYADLFVPDGEFQRLAAGERVLFKKGRAELIAFAITVAERNAGLAQHMQCNVLVEADGKGAKGQCDTALVATIKDNWTCNILLIGEYHDQFLRTPNGWKIARRTVSGPR